MRNIGVIELGSSYVKLEFAQLDDNETFVITNREQQEVSFSTDLATDELLKQEAIDKFNFLLKTYKQKCSTFGISEVYCVASDEYLNAKNQKSFFEEVYSQSGFKFKILSEQEIQDYLYTAFINTLDCPRGLIVDIGSVSTRLIGYNRRNDIGNSVVKIGNFSLTNKFEDKKISDKLIDEMAKEFANNLKDVDWFKNLDEETQLVGTGDIFLSLAKLSRKIKHYQYNRDHAYQLSLEDFEKVYDFAKTLDADKTKRLKGISNQRADVIVSGLAIIKAILQVSGVNRLIISENGIADGVVINKANPLTLEKPLADVLGYSLDCNETFYNKVGLRNTQNIYSLCTVLYRQLKVLHKLPRGYIKVLRIGSYFVECGKRISAINYQKKSLQILLDSDIYGVSHHEQILAAFVVACQYLDDFSMTDWIRYNGILTETDLDAVRKLAVLLRLASKLDVYGNGKVRDLSCDILGDSVIMKTIVDSPADLEVKEAMSVAKDFVKAFKKHLEVL